VCGGGPPPLQFGRLFVGSARPPEAVAAYLGFARIETQAILRDHQHVVFALAKALMSVEPLGATEIDAVIAQMLARRALAAEQGRRAAWRQVTDRVAEITS
jgi:hypothetical protein